ncbi:MAG: hypothetical protein PF541_12525 [Prolixibacteraceae bacterium]|jgi:hypothetical protein|nr:hypothetical protein [Prolixibacteraceae bacterium]
MKKILLLPMLILLSILFVNAQDVDLGNFENNDIAPWTEWDAANAISVQGTPGTGNSSNYAARMIVPSDWQGGITRWDNSSALNDNTIKLVVDVYFVGTSSPTTNFKMALSNSISGGSNIESYTTVNQGVWTTVELDLSTAAVKDFKQVAFQSGNAGVLYLDNVMFIAGVVEDKVLADFDDGTMQSWNSWGAPISNVANPDPVGNTSSLVALFDQTGGAWNGFTHWYNTPVLHDIYIALSVDVYIENTDGTLKLQMDNGSSANYEGYKDIVADTWTTVEYDLSSAAKDYQQIAFQGSVAEKIYLDNIVLKVEEPAPPPPPAVSNPNVWVNEIHYDNVGVDVNEMIEIVLEEPNRWDLSELAIVLYDGATGAEYNTTTLNNFIVGEPDTSFLLYHYIYPAEKLVDEMGGIAVVYEGRVLSFISYEGSFDATDGPAIGVTSIDIGIQEDNYPVGNSIQLSGLGDRYRHFEWIDPVASPGLINASQIIQTPPSIPINWKYFLFVFVAIASTIVYRRFR